MKIFNKIYSLFRNRKKTIHQRIKNLPILYKTEEKPYEQQFYFNNKENFSFGNPKRRWTDLVNSNFKKNNFSRLKNEFNNKIERSLMKQKFQMYYKNKKDSQEEKYKIDLF